MTQSPDNAGVRIPPPLFYAAPVLVGWFLDRLHGLPIRVNGGVGSGFSRIILVVAWLLVATSLSFVISARQLFWRKHTSVMPIRPATTLVVAGPYRLTRNPMYLGLALLTIAWGLFLNSWWPIILLAPTLIAIQHFVISREESYLRRRFGADYVAYTRRVRRWF
jgi:protein-S-isoprenylcysteine O-methyltransferase Ste14